MVFFIDNGHGHAPGRLVKAFHIFPGTEQVDMTILAAVGFGAFEYFLSVMENGRGRVQLQGTIRADSGLMPALLRRILLRKHPVAKFVAKPEIIAQRFFYIRVI
jgi:hypothetical protein